MTYKYPHRNVLGHNVGNYTHWLVFISAQCVSNLRHCLPRCYFSLTELIAKYFLCLCLFIYFLNFSFFLFIFWQHYEIYMDELLCYLIYYLLILMLELSASHLVVNMIAIIKNIASNSKRLMNNNLRIWMKTIVA